MSDLLKIDPELRRAEVPQLLRDYANMGFTSIELTIQPQTAFRMADDIEFAVKFGTTEDVNKVLMEVEALTAERDALRAWLSDALDELDEYYQTEYGGDDPYLQHKLRKAREYWESARAALNEKGPTD